MKIPTKSFTLRIPKDLLEEIGKQVGEKGSRSEFIIDTLRVALGKDSPTTDDRKITEVLLQLEIFKTEGEVINKNLSNSISQILERLGTLEANNLTTSETNRKTKNSANLNIAESQTTYSPEILPETELKLPGMDNQSIIDASASLSEAELIEILRAAEPGGQWRIQKMIERRRKGKNGEKGSMDRLHSVGVHRFKYKAKEAYGENGKITHVWRYWQLTQ